MYFMQAENHFATVHANFLLCSFNSRLVLPDMSLCKHQQNLWLAENFYYRYQLGVCFGFCQVRGIVANDFWELDIYAQMAPLVKTLGIKVFKHVGMYMYW